MSRNFPVPTSRLLLACVLSVLALAFALEAKIAWYGPAMGPGSAVRAAKALPMNTREIGIDSVPAHGHAPLLNVCTLVAVFAATYALDASGRQLLRRNASAAHSVFSVSYLSPQLAYRPPPAR